MGYEEFKKEVERVLSSRNEPMTWSEIKAASGKLKQKAPYHVYVRKLQGDIGLVRFKPKGRRETLWALRKWFEDGMFKELLPERMRFVILHVDSRSAIAADEYRDLRRIFPVEGLNVWDVIDAKIAEFFPAEDKRPESIKIGDVNVLRNIEKDSERLKIAESAAESGEFLHTCAWHGKTLGMTKPRFRCFYFYEDRCQFFCDQRVCLGHDVKTENQINKDEIMQKDHVYFIFESVERDSTFDENEIIWGKKIEWRLKSVIALEDPRQRRLF